MNYQDYINSSAWKRLSQYAIRQAKNRCEHCGTSKWSATLTCHHLTYERLGHERLSDLVVLCRECHDKIHNVGNGGTNKHPLDKWHRCIPFDALMERRHGDWMVKLDNEEINRLWEYYKKHLTLPY